MVLNRQGADVRGLWEARKLQNPRIPKVNPSVITRDDPVQEEGGTNSPLVVGVVSMKGGVGKSSLAAGLATLPNWGGPTVIADLDPQVSCCSWADQREERTANSPDLQSVLVESIQPRRLEKLYSDLCALEEPPALLVVDTAAGAGHGCRAVMELVGEVGGVLLAPVQPAAADCWSIDALQQPGVPKPHVVLNMVRPQGGREGVVRQALEERGFRTLAPAICNRVTWIDSFASGLGPHEMKYGAYHKAARELAALQGCVAEIGNRRLLPFHGRLAAMMETQHGDGNLGLGAARSA